MDDWHRWKRSRYASFVAVLALHAAVLIAFLMVGKTRFFVTIPTMPAIEPLMVPRGESPPERAPPPSTASPNRQTKSHPLPSALPIEVLTVVPTPDGNAAGKAIDWAQEAHDTAASFAQRGKLDGPAAEPAIAPFAQPPTHHKGEQIPTKDGRWMVFVSNNCYQLSKELTYVENATNTGAKIQTYCNRPSKSARGDLFRELPAYKKYHPDQ